MQATTTEQSEVLAILRRARSRLARGFTTGTYACDADGNAVLPRDPAAVCWCSVGAIRAELSQDNPGAMADHAFRLLATAINLHSGASYGHIVSFNDHAGREAVLALWDRMLSDLEAAQ